MNKIIAREVPPQDIDFSDYFDNDVFTNAAGENCAVFVFGSKYISKQDCASFCYDDFEQVYNVFQELAFLLEDEIGETEKINIVKDFFQDKDKTESEIENIVSFFEMVDIYSTSDFVKFLTYYTGKKYLAKTFSGYCQGDYCTVIYCESEYSTEQIEEIGNMYLGCATEYVIDDVGGFFVTDDVRFDSAALRTELANQYGCEPDDLEIWQYSGEHTVSDFKLLEG